MKGKTRFFRVALEGGATDGRTISRDWIQQMADTFNPVKYGARIWLEHIRGLYPDGPFQAYGDVTAVEAREEDDGKLGLYAQLDPTPELIALNKKRQKIYTSIEIDHDFAGSGQAYLVGLAVTDSPASLGTEILEFSQQRPDSSPLSNRKQRKENLFSAGILVDFDFDDDDDDDGEGQKFTERLNEFMAKWKSKFSRQDGHFKELMEIIELQAVALDSLQSQVGSFSSPPDLSKDVSQLREELSKLKSELSFTDGDGRNRPPATGGDNTVVQTDC